MIRALAARATETRERFEITGRDPPESIPWARPQIDRERPDFDGLPEALMRTALVLK